MEKVLINYHGCTGGDFVRSCLWILKNPEHNLYIKENRLMLDDKWLFFIRSKRASNAKSRYISVIEPSKISFVQKKET